MSNLKQELRNLKMNIEGTPEQQRFFDKNCASLDPYADGGLYDKWQEYIHEGETEVQGEYISSEWSQELDEYVEQYHQPELPFETAYEGLGRAITPYRWASYLQDAVTQLCQDNDYHIGRAERCDMAEQILNERMERVATEQEKMDLQQAMQIWYRSYGYGN